MFSVLGGDAGCPDLATLAFITNNRQRRMKINSAAVTQARTLEPEAPHQYSLSLMEKHTNQSIHTHTLTYHTHTHTHHTLMVLYLSDPAAVSLPERRLGHTHTRVTVSVCVHVCVYVCVCVCDVFLPVLLVLQAAAP